MRNKKHIKIWALHSGIILSFVFAGMSYAQGSIRLGGLWRLTIDENDLLAGAGSDLNSTYESDADEVIVRNIGHSDYKKGDDWYWKVEISKSDGNWHSNFYLDVRRTSDGTSEGGSISGLTSYEEIINADPTPPTFTGVRHHRNINMQYRLRGVSLQIPADIYDTTVIYTLMEL